MLLGVGLGFCFEYLDTRIKDPDEIKTVLGLSLLGLVPAFQRKEITGPPLFGDGVPAAFSEAFRGIRTNLLFASAAAGPKTVVVTSTGPGEGKSVVSSNIAASLAHANMRVLLIDADMRLPQTHEIFGMSPEPGLSNVLVGNAKASDAVRRTTIPNLWLLPSGKLPPNPAELLGSARFQEFIGSLDEHFDWVIIDSPPVMAVTDPGVLAHVATGVVFVVGSEMTSKWTARAALAQLDAARPNYLGAILNKVEVRRHPGTSIPSITARNIRSAYTEAGSVTTSSTPWVMCVVATLACSAAAFGAIYPWAYMPLVAASAMLGVVGLIWGRGPVPWPLIASLALVALAVSLQLVPLNEYTLASLSPRALDIHRQRDLAAAVGAAASFPLSIDPPQTRLALMFLAAFALLLAGTARMLSGHSVRQVAASLAVVGVALAIVGLVQRATFNGKIYGFWELAQGGSPFGPFINRNHFAGWMLMVVPLTVGLFASLVSRRMAGVGPHWRARVLWFASTNANKAILAAFAVMTMALALVVTLSRSGITAFVGAMAFAAVVLLTRRSEPARGGRRFVAAFLTAGLDCRGVVGRRRSDCGPVHRAKVDWRGRPSCDLGRLVAHGRRLPADRHGAQHLRLSRAVLSAVAEEAAICGRRTTITSNWRRKAGRLLAFQSCCRRPC